MLQKSASPYLLKPSIEPRAKARGFCIMTVRPIEKDGPTIIKNYKKRYYNFLVIVNFFL